MPLLAAALVLGSKPVAAHEFWIAPEAYQVAPGEAITANLRNGERFVGDSLLLVPSRIARFEIVQGAQVVPSEGRIGDRPALSQPAPGEGLAIVVYASLDIPLTYDEFMLFVGFAAHKGFPEVVAEHVARGLPRPVQEVFRRYAKSLVAVGEGAGADRRVGLGAEIVALANPYAGDLAEMPVEVWFEGALAADQQVEIFTRDADGAVTITTRRTDARGRAVVPLAPGTEVMLDSVFMRPLDPAEHDGAGWMSHWANLTFAVP